MGVGRKGSDQMEMSVPPAKQDQEPRSTLEQVYLLFHALTSDLPARCASVHVAQHDESSSVRIVPSNPNAAPIAAIIPRDEQEGVTLVGGKGSFFEIPRGGRRYTKLPLIEEARAICSAIIAGKLEESVVLDGPEVLRGEGTIELPDGATTVRWRRLSLRSVKRREARNYRYEPYCV